MTKEQIKQIEKENMTLAMNKLLAITCDIMNGRIAKISDEQMLKSYGCTQKDLWQQIHNIEKLIEKAG